MKKIQENKQAIENLIQKDYKTLWNKSETSPFNIKDASNVYLESEKLTIIDPDFKMMDKTAPTKVIDYAKVMPQLAAPWDMVAHGGITEISNIQSDIYLNKAFVSFDAVGKMTFTNNESVDLQRNVTQFLENTPKGWRIAYEHVS
ncbi:MAG: hypothetical protein Mars2KO_42440 [Maribacter sp.]